jgi:hypothetical protein
VWGAAPTSAQATVEREKFPIQTLKTCNFPNNFALSQWVFDLLEVPFIILSAMYWTHILRATYF